MSELHGYMQKFFLSHPVFGEKEVTRKEFIAAERAAGFYSTTGSDVATGGFSSLGGLSGSVRYIRVEEENL